MNKRLEKLLERQLPDIKDIVRLPASLKFFNKDELGTVDERMALYMRQADEIGLQFPIILKLKQGQTNKYAHEIFCVNNEAGMREALDFIGYKNSVLLC